MTLYSFPLGIHVQRDNIDCEDTSNLFSCTRSEGKETWNDYFDPKTDAFYTDNEDVAYLYSLAHSCKQRLRS